MSLTGLNVNQHACSSDHGVSHMLAGVLGIDGSGHMALSIPPAPPLGRCQLCKEAARQASVLGIPMAADINAPPFNS